MCSQQLRCSPFEETAVQQTTATQRGLLILQAPQGDATSVVEGKSYLMMTAQLITTIHLLKLIISQDLDKNLTSC